MKPYAEGTESEYKEGNENEKEGQQLRKIN